MKKLISVVTPCYNEEGNVRLLYNEVKIVFEKLTEYDYEHIFIDNASKDKTVSILKEIASNDKNVKIIVNVRNFGHLRSPFYGLLQAKGDAIILIVSDLQDPPSLIMEFVKKWEEGYKVVVGIKNQSEENFIMFATRKLYYNCLDKLSDVSQIKNFTGFGLYDRKIIEILRDVSDPNPYFRGLISEMGYDVCSIEYKQPTRKRGITKNNFYSLYDVAMMGITNHTKVPLRLAAMIGFSVSIISLLVAIIYTIYKIAFWDRFSVGIAPLVIGIFFFSSIQLFFIGVIGEYIGSIYTQVLKRPLVIERERINFEEEND